MIEKEIERGKDKRGDRENGNVKEKEIERGSDRTGDREKKNC